MSTEKTPPTAPVDAVVGRLIECLSCYEEFEHRKQHPEMRCCEKCVPDADNVDENRCPKCGWDCESMTHDELAPVNISERRPDWEYGYCGGEHWYETWTCPECGTEFGFYNGSV